ncbi:hypothetical protein ElyMa_001241300 [Elysia marginata]|uniref:Uncharacterized protein n=1 Tax=Elysia marginata TaxID=1093978 RepID=A0AAV4I9U9_9GAST|nr:hypothetical protein ElyMa_001241300 [Elysia marginata]
MPFSGFPTILESILISLFQESQLASYKLAGNQQRTILVLRFDAMADASVSTSRLKNPCRSSSSDRPSQLELSVSPKYTLPQQPVSATGPPTSINAQVSKDCCESDTPMLAVDSQEKCTQAAEKSSETTVYSTAPD